MRDQFKFQYPTRSREENKTNEYSANSPYVEIRPGEQIKSPALKKLLFSALAAYRKRMVV